MAWASITMPRASRGWETGRSAARVAMRFQPGEL